MNERHCTNCLGYPWRHDDKTCPNRGESVCGEYRPSYAQLERENRELKKLLLSKPLCRSMWKPTKKPRIQHTHKKVERGCYEYREYTILLNDTTKEWWIYDAEGFAIDAHKYLWGAKRIIDKLHEK